MPSQAYYNGDYYDCIVDTVAGESPASAPTKWAKVEIPRFMEEAMVQGAFAASLARAGQNDKRNTEFKWYQEMLDDITGQAMLADRDAERVEVFTR